MGTLTLEQLMQPAIDLAENGIWSLENKLSVVLNATVRCSPK